MDLMLVAAVLVPVALLGLSVLLRMGRYVAAASAGAGARVATSLRRTAARLLRARAVTAALGLGATAAAALASPSAASAAAPASSPALGRPAEPAPLAVRPAASTGVHVVRPGESLWSIAEQHLGPAATAADVAAAWPRWYRANRAAVGADPSLLRVGLRLRVPSAGARAETPHHRTPAPPSPARTTGRRTGTSAPPRTADPAPARTTAHPAARADSLDPDRR